MNEPVFMTVNFNGSFFEIEEAYIHAEKRIQAGTIAEHLSFFNEIIGEWYSAQIETEDDYIVATGYVSMIDNPEYTGQLKALQARVATHSTRKAEKHADKATQVL